MSGIFSRVPILGALLGRIRRRLRRRTRRKGPFPGSAAYWEKRYSAGGNSGVGSYALFAEFKAEVLNDFVATHAVRTVIELGCGDGNQLGLAKYESYLGFDVSDAAVARCRERFGSDASKSFRPMSEYDGETADLTLSLDVIYHLVEDDVFERYLRTLFGASRRYVIIYSSDSDDNRGYEGTHVRHRKFTRWIQENLTGWKLSRHLPNRYPYRGDYRTGSFADFFLYERV
jgi:SAM-dependent methyltransferase